MSRALDPRFGKVVATMRSATIEGERQAAQVAAVEMAGRAGMTLKRALKEHDSPASKAAVKAPNIFAGFDDWMEEREPGHKARAAGQKVEKERARLERVASLIGRYGSTEAVLQPCERELKLRAALGDWWVPCKPPHDRWTDNISGCRSPWEDKTAAARIVARLDTVDLPKTFREAAAEVAYWTGRRQDMEDVLGPNGFGDDGLDLVASFRLDRVRELAEKEIRVTSLVDLHSRFAIYRAGEVDDAAVEQAIFRDLTSIIGLETNG